MKEAIITQVKVQFPGMDADIQNWKGQDIVNFQEDLQEKVNGTISEKWFYTHLKSENKRLPRIDMLNMLSEYAGFVDWADFKNSQGDIVQKSEPRKYGSWVKVTVLVILGILIALIINRFTEAKSFEFCFVDANSRLAIVAVPLEIAILNDEESPILKQSDSCGCFTIKSNEPMIRFVVKSPYYNTDTITRIFNKSLLREEIKLRTNDYALIIHYFSTANVTDWQQRRNKLNNMFADNAQIYQVFDNRIGMGVYNKTEFIDKMTMPLKSLKNIEIVETIYSGKRISMLRFKQNETK